MTEPKETYDAFLPGWHKAYIKAKNTHEVRAYSKSYHRRAKFHWKAVSDFMMDICQKTTT